MVSLSDTAKQVQYSSAKQDAAEAAFKARHSFDSSDAFKQIFDGISKTSEAAPAAKPCDAEPVKHDAAPKAHEKKCDDASSHNASNNDADKDAQNDVADTSANDVGVKKAHHKHHRHDKKISKDTVDKDSDVASKCDGDKDADAPANLAVTTNTTVEAKKNAEGDDVGGDDAGDEIAKDASEGTDAAIAANADGSADLGDEAAAAASATSGADRTKTPDATLALTAGLKVIPKDLLPTLKLTDAHLSLKGITDLQSAFRVFRNDTPKEETAKPATADATDGADAAFSAAVDAQAKLTQDTQVKTAQEDAKDKQAATKEANAKHADHIELLQGQFSASETSPATGDRAISVAVKASGSPAPTFNGSAGGGSPIAPKGDGSAAAITGFERGLEGMHQGVAEPATFTAALRGTKDAQASLMVPSEQVSVQLHRMAKSGMSQYDLQLHPADLGRVDIRLEISKDGAVQATITADNQQAFDMLQKDSRSLERALQQAGLQTDSGSLSFNLRGQDAQAQQQQANQNSGGAWNRWMDKTLPDEVVQSKVLTYDVGVANGRVDLRV